MGDQHAGNGRAGAAEPRGGGDALKAAAKTIRRQVTFYEQLRTRMERAGVPEDDPLRGAVARAWEAVYAMGVALEQSRRANGAGWHAGEAPPEVCDECAKEIGGGQTAHVFDDRGVCLACYCKLKAERARVTAEQATAGEPPTPQQLAYARRIGVPFPADVTGFRLGELVRDYLTRPAPPDVQQAAAAMGVADAQSKPWRSVRGELDDRQVVLRWVLSVCRHMLGATWRDPADCRLPHNAVVPILTRLATHPDTVQAIRGYEGGIDVAAGANRQLPGPSDSGHQNNGAATPAAVPAAAAAAWVAFGSEAVRDALYLDTRKLIEQELWAYLRHLPKHPRPGRDR